MRSKLVYELETVPKTYWITLSGKCEYRVYEYSHTVGDVKAVQNKGVDAVFQNKENAINFINELIKIAN